MQSKMNFKTSIVPLVLVFLWIEFFSDSKAEALLNGTVISDRDFQILYADNDSLPSEADDYEDGLNIKTLRYTCIITRHGSRSPISTYPTDPYPYDNITYWPDGPGQLTNYGKQQMYKTGQLLRMRYNGFLNVNYFPKDTLVRTNPFDRDFMSAACLLAGLYPPTGYQLWNPAILWQPIPIWLEPFDVGDITWDPNVCPSVMQDQKKMLNELNTRYTNNPLLEWITSYMSSHMGRNITNYQEFVDLWDTLYLQEENGYILPKWTVKIYPKFLTLMSARGSDLIAGTPNMIRLTAGPLLKKISVQLSKKANGTLTPNRRMYIEAAHDVTLTALLAGLGCNNHFPVETSAFMVFELHENLQGFIVKMLYFNSSSVSLPTVLDPPKCRYPCLLGSFRRLANELAPSDWNAECGLPDLNAEWGKQIVIYFLLVTNFILIFYLLINKYCK